MTHYLIYWKPETSKFAYTQTDELLCHSASEQYRKLGIGDVLWIVGCYEPDHLLLVGRQRVDRILSQHDADRLYEEDLWEANYRAISNEPERPRRTDISSIARDLQFVSETANSLPRGFTGQHLQSMRRLDRESEKMMEEAWEHGL